MSYAVPDMSAVTNTDALAATAILIVGAPRSGTTWLAKIFDSHPDVIYRHEPDEIVPASGSIRADMARWIRQHDARTAGKRPFFPKSWQTVPARLLRTSLAYGGAATNRIGLPAWPIPDLGDTRRARVVIKSVRLNVGIGAFARAYPDGRAVLILRHPCGQVSSVMRGTSAGRFELAQPGTDMPFDEAGAVTFAARFGVEEATFQRLPNAAKYAWSWRAFNEIALDSISGLSNARVAVYEDLCAGPGAEAGASLDFCGLRWNRQTEAFLARSTSHEEPGYYAVVRDSIAAANRWRASMPGEDQAAVRAVVRESPLRGYWADLTD